MLIYKHQTKVVFIDDDKDQIDALRDAMSLSEVNGEYYTKAEEALKDINDNIDDTEQRQLVLGNIFQQFKKSRCKNKISTVISDYSMPNITGLDVLHEIQDKNIYKLLYTGVADEKIGVRELNKGNIDIYYNKGDSIEELISIIKKGEIAYFQRLLSNAFYKIKDNMYTNILESKVFDKFFTDILIANNIVEFCLVDENGSFILIDRNQNIYTLLVMSTSSLGAQIEVAKEKKCSNYVINSMKDISKMFYISKFHEIKQKNGIDCKKLDCEKETIQYSLLKENIFDLTL